MEQHNEDGKSVISGKHKDETIYVDNAHFDDCILQRCKLVFGGGEFTVDGIRLIDCEVQFTNEAANTITFIKLFCDKSGVPGLVGLELEPEKEKEDDIKNMMPISLLEQ